MGRKIKFNSILVKDSKSDSLLLIPFQEGKIAEEGLKIELDKEALEKHLVKGEFPRSKILLLDTVMDGENSSFIPKGSVDLVLKGKSVDFWDVVGNPDYISYFLQKI